MYGSTAAPNTDANTGTEHKPPTASHSATASRSLLSWTLLPEPIPEENPSGHDEAADYDKDDNDEWYRDREYHGPWYPNTDRPLYPSSTTDTIPEYKKDPSRCVVWNNEAIAWTAYDPEQHRLSQAIPDRIASKLKVMGASGAIYFCARAGQFSTQEIMETEVALHCRIQEIVDPVKT